MNTQETVTNTDKPKSAFNLIPDESYEGTGFGHLPKIEVPLIPGESYENLGFGFGFSQSRTSPTPNAFIKE